MKNEIKNCRIWELDFIRGIALILMIYFHIIFDLKEILLIPVKYESGINYYIGKISAILFILVSGVSTWLSRNNVKRALRVLGCALIITVISHIYSPSFGVKFGVLHFLGVSMLISPLFSKISSLILIILGTFTIFPGILVSKVNTSLGFLFPFGLTGPQFQSSDYYPLLPYFGIFLYGMALGKILYNQKQSLFSFKLQANFIIKTGRKTLIIYLFHQPVIIGVLILLRYLNLL